MINHKPRVALAALAAIIALVAVFISPGTAMATGSATVTAVQVGGNAAVCQVQITYTWHGFSGNNLTAWLAIGQHIATFNNMKGNGGSASVTFDNVNGLDPTTGQSLVYSPEGFLSKPVGKPYGAEPGTLVTTQFSCSG